MGDGIVVVFCGSSSSFITGGLGIEVFILVEDVSIQRERVVSIHKDEGRIKRHPSPGFVFDV